MKYVVMLSIVRYPIYWLDYNNRLHYCATNGKERASEVANPKYKEYELKDLIKIYDIINNPDINFHEKYLSHMKKLIEELVK